MLHNEARNLPVEAYEKTRDAKAVALAYGVSVPTVYRLAEQKAKTGSVGLRVSERGRKRVLTAEDSERIAKVIDSQLDITLSEIVEKLNLPVGIETVRRKIQAMGYRRKKRSQYQYGHKVWPGKRGRRVVDHAPLNTSKSTTILSTIRAPKNLCKRE